MTIRPVRDQVVALPQVQRKTDGGLYIPETAEEEQMTPKVALVVAVGPGRLLEDGTTVPMSCKAGDRIAYRPGYGNFDRFKIADRVFLLLEDKNVLAVIEDNLVQPVEVAA